MICALAFITASCGFKSEEKPLYGSLVTFTAPEKNNETVVLLGVKEKGGSSEDDIVIIKPSLYESITADDNVIICRVSDIKVEAYKHDGRPIGSGKFETFTALPRQEKVYMGTKYKRSCWYFPEQYETCFATGYFQGVNLLFLHAGSGKWEVRRYDGTKIWTSPEIDEGCRYWLIKDVQSAGEEIYIAVTGKKTPACTLYDSNGHEIKKLDALHWKQMQKEMKEQKELDKQSIYAEFNSIKKL